MKFMKEYSGQKLIVPSGAMKLSGFEPVQEMELHTLDGALIILKKRMTAMELISTIDTLTQFCADLTTDLVQACSSYDILGGIGDSCPPAYHGDEVSLPDYLLEGAGIPKSAKLCVSVDADNATITIQECESFDLTDDVPEYILSILKSSGACLGKLEDYLFTDEDIYGV